MVEKMPSIIKHNFIYSKIWHLLFKEDMNAVLLFNGDVGTGKSTGALRVSEDLDSGFNIERVCFSLTDFFKIIKEGDSNGKLKRGSVVIFDEAAGSDDSIDAREALSHTNKIVSKFTTISRAKGLVIIYCTPLRSQLDKRVRLIGVTGVMDFFGIDRVNKRSRANFHWSYVSSGTDKAIMPRPRIREVDSHKLIDVPYVTIPLPSKELIKAYKVKKSAFIDANISNWYNQMKAIKSKKGDNTVLLKTNYNKIMKDVNMFRDTKGILSTAMIRIKLGLSERLSSQLKQVVEADLLRNESTGVVH